MWRWNYEAQNRIEYVSALQTTISFHCPGSPLSHGHKAGDNRHNLDPFAGTGGRPTTQRKRGGGGNNTACTQQGKKLLPLRFFSLPYRFSLFASEIKTRNETTDILYSTVMVMG
jgi:hypothetical protein